MPGRTFLFVGILIVAVAGPYLLSRRGGPSGPAEGKAPSPTLWDRVSQWGSDAATPSPDAGNAANLRLHATQSDGLPGRPVPTQQLGGPAGISLPNAIRLDVTPEWIAQNWARVSTQLADPDYYGVRVPLVTGTELHDVAGSLSLYFNEERRLERLMFYGYTGDTQPLVALMEQRFGMRRYATTANAGLYLGLDGPVPRRDVGRRAISFRRPINLNRDTACSSSSTCPDPERRSVVKPLPNCVSYRTRSCSEPWRRTRSVSRMQAPIAEVVVGSRHLTAEAGS